MGESLVCVNLLVTAVIALVFPPLASEMAEEDSTHGIPLIGRLLFCIYAPSMYIYLSGLARCSPGLLTLINDVGRREYVDSNHTSPCTTKYPLKTIFVVVFFLCVSNVIINIFDRDIVLSILGLSHHPVYLVYLYCLLWLCSTAWLLPIPFVYLGCKLMTEKVQYMIRYVHKEFETRRMSDDLESPVDLAFVMAWHDELYEKNRLLNQILSGIITLTVAFLTLATTAIALNIAINGFNGADFFWFLANFIILAATCYPAAELEVQNKILSIELGSLPMPRRLTSLNLYLNLYQTCTIKASRSMFGIFVKGTKIRITFNGVIRIGSITFSAIIFLGGVLQASNAQ